MEFHLTHASRVGGKVCVRYGKVCSQVRLECTIPYVQTVHTVCISKIVNVSYSSRNCTLLTVQEYFTSLL